MATKKPAAPKKPKAETTAEAAEGRFLLTVRMNDQVFESRVDSIADALLALNPPTIKTKVIVRAETEGRHVEAVLFQARAKRTFRNRLAAQFMEKSLRTALNAND